MRSEQDESDFKGYVVAVFKIASRSKFEKMTEEKW